MLLNEQSLLEPKKAVLPPKVQPQQKSNLRWSPEVKRQRKAREKRKLKRDKKVKKRGKKNRKRRKKKRSKL